MSRSYDAKKKERRKFEKKLKVAVLSGNNREVSFLKLTNPKLFEEVVQKATLKQSMPPKVGLKSGDPR